jgi:hypothetical protein
MGIGSVVASVVLLTSLTLNGSLLITAPLPNPIDLTIALDGGGAVVLLSTGFVDSFERTD